jgi:hypothetical protein
LWTTTCSISGSGLSLACCWPFCLFSVCLLNVCAEIGFLLSPLLQCSYSTLPPLLCVNFQFLVIIVQFCLLLFCFCGAGNQSSQGAMLGFARGGCGSTACCLFAHLFGLPNVSQLGLEGRLAAWEPSYFLSVMFLREALYSLGVQGVKVLILLHALFQPRVAPVSQQDLWSSHCLLLHPSHHLGSSLGTYLF